MRQELLLAPCAQEVVDRHSERRRQPGKCARTDVPPSSGLDLRDRGPAQSGVVGEGLPRPPPPIPSRPKACRERCRVLLAAIHHLLHRAHHMSFDRNLRHCQVTKAQKGFAPAKGRRSRVELRQLRYFVTLAEERHFGRAADLLHIAQPGLSQQIKALERSVGVVLFDRETRPVALTEAGLRLLPHARAIVEAASRAVEVTREARPPGPILKIGVPAIGHYPEFAALVDTFRAREPDVILRLEPSVTPAILDGL